MNQDRMIKIIIGLTLVSAFGFYAYRQSNDFLKGPTITVTNYHTGQTVNQEFITLEGRAERISRLYLNGNQIFTDDEGVFHQSLLLFPGYNILEIKAEDAFDRQTARVLELVHIREKAPLSANR
ncbi:MAG: hypothetical protein WDZ85_02510 [Candidatus Paceibacterota bacterium]